MRALSHYTSHYNISPKKERPAEQVSKHSKKVMQHANKLLYTICLYFRMPSKHLWKAVHVMWTLSVSSM